jgi:hypothetical protein
MVARHRRSSRRAALQAIEMAWAVPQVVAHRLARMSIAAPAPSARDRAEFQRMGTEKMAAFHEAWNAMLLETMRIQFQLWGAAMLGSLPRSPGAASALAQRSTLALLRSGTAPYHRRAVANARRLRRTTLR